MPIADAARNLDDPSTLYERDFTLWCTRQAELLRLRRFGEADLPNIVESWRAWAPPCGPRCGRATASSSPIC